MNLNINNNPQHEDSLHLVQAAKPLPRMGDHEFDQDSEHMFAVTVKQDKKIIGGAIATINLGWIYITSIWVADEQRGKGIGRQIMQAVESYGATQNALGIYLYTAEFQATPFYKKLGYTIIGQLSDRPPGYMVTFFAKTDLQNIARPENIQIEDPIDETTQEIIDGGLIADSEAIVPLNAHDRIITLHDNDNQLCGGVYGNDFWGWFDVHLCWGENIVQVARLLGELESLCQQQALTGITIVIYNEEDFKILRERGYEVFAILNNRPEGSTCRFLAKRLTTP